MNVPEFTALTGLLPWVTLLAAVRLSGQPLEFTSVEQTPDAELALTLSAPRGWAYRIETSTNAQTWNGVVTFPTNGTTTLRYTDSGAPFLPGRYYRAVQLTESRNLSGDHLSTTNGDVIIHTLYHASFMMSWNGNIIYSDPDDDPAYESRYAGLPQGDLILVTHEHGDHYSAAKLSELRAPDGMIIVPQRVYDLGSFAPFRPHAIVLSYGAATNVLGIEVLAVPGYNNNHAFANNNCYVLTLGGKRIFISGDTGDVPEIRALTEIDVAFLCMNIPFTMTVDAATNCVRAMRPGVVYPYHYRDQGGSTTNAATFKQWLGTDPGIEVRLRNWY
jgi:L-ascorbate metabolism protein UlaG (beta-lactamase superfamily)